jgi:hypothetical protein
MNHPRYATLVAATFAALCAAAVFAGPKQPPKAPVVDPYEPVVRQIEGWTVNVEPSLVDGEHAEEGKLALKMLGNHLQRISILVPEKQLAELKKVEFWIEHAHPELTGKQYHPGKKWLVDRGYDSRLTNKVHITHAEELFSREQLLKHPAVILHELAHAYHDLVLDFDDAEIVGAYDKAMAKGLYDKVMLYDGRLVKAYAATNHKEYFAEATEAYLYRNDFYPFVNGELKKHDPRMFAQMERVWGKTR